MTTQSHSQAFHMWAWLKSLVSSGPPAQETTRKHFTLEIGGETIAVIEVYGLDFPWTYGRLTDTSKFERYRPYFTDVTSWPEEDPELDSLCSEIRSKGGFHLQCLETGERFTDVFLNREDDVVWFRY